MKNCPLSGVYFENASIKNTYLEASASLEFERFESIQIRLCNDPKLCFPSWLLFPSFTEKISNFNFQIKALTQPTITCKANVWHMTKLPFNRKSNTTYCVVKLLDTLPFWFTTVIVKNYKRLTANIIHFTLMENGSKYQFEPLIRP